MGQYRTQKQWFELITQCRQSGMTDMEWCRINGISRSTFYKALSRLRVSACEVPESSRLTEGILDLKSVSGQEVVPINIVPDKPAADVVQTRLLSGSCAMEIIYGGMTIRISNDIDRSLLSHTLKSLGGMP